jgi:gliding motility-associated-like protein
VAYHKLILFYVIISLLLPFSVRGVTAGFTADHPNGCAPQVVNFTNTSSGASSYYWDFGNGYTSVLTNPSTSYTTVGSYTVKLIATSSTGAKDSTTLTITVYNVPSVKFSADSVGCVGSTFHFYDSTTLYSSGSGTYLWNFGDGNTSTSRNPTYTYNTAGTYTITLSVTNSVGCSSFLRKTNWLNVISPPSVSFNADTTVLCGPTATAHFNNNTSGASSPFSYRWSFGDGGSSTSASPSHTYSSNGSYSIKLVASNSIGCSDSLTRTSYIIVTSETANFSLSSSGICPGQSVTVSNTSSPSYNSSKWNFGDGATSTSSSATHTYSSPGTYTIKLVTTYGCTDSTTKTVTVNSLPVPDFSDSPSHPCPAPVNIYFLNKSTGGATYFWDFGDGTTSVATNPVKTYYRNMDASFNIKLIATSSVGCKDSITKNIEIKILPLKLTIYGNSDSGSTGGCVSLTVNFSYYAYYDTPIVSSATAYPYSISSVSWDFGDSYTSTSATPSHTYSSTGTYTVTLTVTTVDGCTKTSTFVVHVGSTPSVTFGADITHTCAGTPVTFKDTATGATSFSWSFGEPGGYATTSSNTITYKFKYPGLHTVSVIAYNNGCGYTFTRSNYIQIDSASAIFNYSYSCDTNLRINFTNNSLGASTYNWDFGDGTTSTTSAVSFFHVFPSAGTYAVQLVIHNNSTGCSDTLSKSIIVYDPHASFSSPDTLICLNSVAHLTGSLTGGTPRSSTSWPYTYSTAYTWVFDGTTTITDTSSTINYTYATRGYHTVKVIIYDTRNGGACKDTFTRVNYIGVARPTSGFYASPIPVCGLLSVLFKDTSTDISGVSITDRAWTFGDGNSKDVATDTTSHSYTNTGNYTIRLITTDNIGCSDTLTKNAYVQVQRPLANFSASPTYVCQYNPVSFFNSSSGSPTSYRWDFGDGGSSTTASPTHIYTASGTYTIKFVISNALGCMDSITRTNYITVNPKPVAKFTMSDTVKICAPMPVNFSDVTTGGTSWAWDFGDGGGTSTSKNSSWTYLTAGSYSITDIVTNNYGCKDTGYGTVHLLGYSGALYYSPLKGCKSLTDSFSSLVTAGIPDFIFDFADGSTYSSSHSTASHTYTRPGKYLPKIIFTNDSGCSSYSLGLDTIRVDTLWPGIKYAPMPFCDSGNVTFTDTSRSPYSYIVGRQWIFHDGTTSTAISPAKRYHGPGTYSIKLFDTSYGGCTTELDTSITIYPFPKFSLSDTFHICDPFTVKFSDSTIGGSLYTWYYGDLFTGTGKTSTHTYTSAGLFKVKEVVTNVKGCVDTAYGTVHILGSDGDLLYNPLKGCKGTIFNFSSAVTWRVPDYKFDFGDGTTLKTSSPNTTHVYTKIGYFIPSLTFTNDSGCSSTSKGLDTIFIDGVEPGFTTLPKFLCDSGNVELLDTSKSLYSPIVDHRWVFDDGTKFHGRSAFHHYDSAGLYPVTLIDSTAWGCLDTNYLNFLVYTSPIISAGKDTTICLGDEATLSATGGISYTWTPATVSCDTCNITYASPATKTEYTVIGKDIHGCKGTDTVEVFIKTKSSGTTARGGEICKGDSIQLYDSGSSNLVYNWIPPDGLSDPHKADPIAKPSTTTTYMLIAKQGSCIADTEVVTVTVHPTPVIFVSPADTTIIAGNTLQFNTAGTDISKYKWAPPEYLSCDSCADPVVTPFSTTMYTIYVSSDFGCTDSTIARINVICDHSQVYVPNTFTPNGDGNNDRFYPRGKGIQIIQSFRVYNRWGQLVYEQRNINLNDKGNGWDGTYKGSALPPDVFVYTIDAICDTGEPISWKGDIALIR